jgi:hypothetical protein
MVTSLLQPVKELRILLTQSWWKRLLSGTGQFTTQLSYNKVIVVCNCLSLINKLKASSRDRSHIGIIVDDIKCLSRASSIAFSFNHASRMCNQVAHVLAKSAGLLCESVGLMYP